jgi:hypothetical protein
MQVHTDPGAPLLTCGAPGTVSEVCIVLRNVDFVVSAVDFTVNYPSSMTWLADLPPDPAYTNEVVTIGQSPTGIAVAWAICCMQNASNGLVVLRALVMWNGCNCNESVTVTGYGALGKTQPTVVRAEDFQEFEVKGLLNTFAGCPVAVQPTTWGSVKALYR